jgi:hypothetical protein
MATLDALRHYFRSHSTIRNLRVVGMLAVLLLLTYMFIMSILIADYTLPVQCVFISPETDSTSSSTLLPPDPITSTAYALAMFLIIYGYFVRIQGLYSSQRGGYYVLSWLLWRISTHQHTSITHAQYVLEYQAFSRVSELENIRVSQTGFRRSQRVALYRYSRSFLSSLSGIAFSYSYGVTQVVSYRWQVGVTLTQDATYMGFGQITAIFLLCLPFLAAAETYYGRYYSS